MKKILIFGCSFTLGSYEYVGYGETKERLKNHNGWWYFVDYFKDKNITVFACPGQGYWTYYQILLLLIEKNKLDYDEIWIQETYEPRGTIYDKKLLDKILAGIPETEFHLHDNDYLYTIYQKGNHNNALNLNPSTAKEENKLYTLWTDRSGPYLGFFNDISEMCSVKIDNLCKEHNIKGYVWTMENPFMECNHFTRLPVTLIRRKLYNNKSLWTLNKDANHQTEEGNKYIAKLIDEACIDMKI